MEFWQCCRMCFGNQNLSLIFRMPEHSEKYTNLIFNTTGIKVSLNDSLSQMICVQCTNFINKSNTFRKKCMDTQKLLLNQLKHNSFEIKTKPNNTKSDSVFIDITDFLIDDDFQDDDDNITLNEYSMEIGKNRKKNHQPVVIAHSIANSGVPIIKNIFTSNNSLNKNEEKQSANNVTIETDFDNPMDNSPLPIDYVATTIDNVVHTIDDKSSIDNDAPSIDYVASSINNESLPTVSILNDTSTVKSKKCNTNSQKLLNEGSIEESIKRKEKPAKKRSRTKKENQKKTDKKEERVKEEIECKLCHKVLTSKLSLRNHNKIHTGFDIVCEHCGKRFITRRLLLMHCKAKHGYEKTDKCSYCDYKASNAEQVKIHERLHTGEKPYACASCGASFHRKSSYLQHVAIHLPDKTVQCEVCPARFKSVTLMRIHRARHKPPQYVYGCRVCGDSFSRRRNVARHLSRIHALPPADYIHRARRLRDTA